MGESWEPLASEDPIPGEPAMVEDLAGKLADVAARMDEQLSTLEQINAGEVWDSDAAAGFIEIQGELAPDLRLARERYETVSTALADYAPQLRAAQEEAELARVQAQVAQDDIEHAESLVAIQEDYEENEAQRIADHNAANPDTPIEPEPYAGADGHEELEDARRRLENARTDLEAAIAHRDNAAVICADRIHDARNDDLKDPSGWRKAWNSATGWASDRWDDLNDAWDTVSDALVDLGRALAGFAWDVIRTGGIRIAQTLCLIAETLTMPLTIPLGAIQVTLAYLNGERDLDDLGRHFINSRATTTGQLLGLADTGDLEYNEEYGVWIAKGADGIDLGPVTIPTHGASATAYGSSFVTKDTPETIRRHEGVSKEAAWEGRIAHEAVHADQWALLGGGFIYVSAYLEDWRVHDYEYSDDMYFEEPAYDEQERVEREHGGGGDS